MHSAEKLSLEQIRSLVAASEGLRFESENRRQMYAWVESVLIVMGLTLAVMLWALYRQASIVSRGYLASAEDAKGRE